MEITVALEDRYAITPDGSLWSQGGVARNFWERYLEVFDSVRIVARAYRAEQAPEGWRSCLAGGGVSLYGLPDYRGPLQFLKRYFALRTAIHSVASARGAIILRGPSQIANMLERQLQQSHPYALEVVGDPDQVFAPGALDHPLRPFFRWYFSRRLRRQCLRAIGVAYVTKEALQKCYPAKPSSVSIAHLDPPRDAALGRTVTTYYSSVELDSTNISECVRTPKKCGPYQLVTVGSLAQMYKGPDVLIEAIARCVRAGLDLTAVIVGEGKFRLGLMAQAEGAGVASRVKFAGHVTPGEPVRRVLDAADLFVLPSRTEGLPRALIEAMARGLPCIGSAVGGIPELLDPTELVPAGDSAALAARIEEVLRNPSRMERLSRQNLSVAREYSDSVLSPRRRRFYQYVRDYTQVWESRQEQPGRLN